MAIPPEMIAAVDDNASSLLSIDGVTGVGIGFTEVGGVLTDTIAIIVSVADTANIPDGIPETLGEFPVAIVKRNVVLLKEDDTRYETLAGGISINRQGSKTGGTLGGIARDSANGELRGLSNAHVLMIGGGKPGDLVQQPGDLLSNPKDVIGKILRSSTLTPPLFPLPPNLPIASSDAATCSIELEKISPPARLAAAKIIGIVRPVNGTGIAEPGDHVMKRGKTTGLTFGTVSQAHQYRVSGFDGQGFQLVDQFEISVDSSRSTMFSDLGDSGSLIVNEDTGEVVGLLWGGSSDPDTGIGNGLFGYASDIGNIETDLGISFFWPIPQVSALTPDTGSSAGGDKVVIDGVGFQLTSKVTVGGVPVNFQFVSDTQIVIPNMPPGTGAVDVVVTGPGGTSLIGRAESTFTYISAGKTSLVSPRFYGQDLLNSCLAGYRITVGGGDPPEPVALIQQALSDLGFSIEVDGDFGSETGAVVADYKTGKGISPNDPVVSVETMTALDTDFAHELIDAKANDIAGTEFALGDRIGTRVDLEDGFATCEFQNGICAELGHLVAYAMPSIVQDAFVTAGGLDGEFGAPVSDPISLDGSRSVQQFASAAFIFGGAQNFSLSIDLWQASIAGGSMIGFPLGPPQRTAGGATFVPHDQGVVLAVPDVAPQPVPQAVFDLWSTQESAGTSLGAPIGFAFPSTTGTTIFPFSNGGIQLNEVGVASLVGLVSGDLQRYFQPADNSLFLNAPIPGTKATPIIGGAAAFASMKADIAAANGPNDFVYILSWHCNVDLQLVAGDPNSTLRSLLTFCANSKVQVRAMLWAGDPIPPPPTIVGFLGGAAVPWALAKDYARMKTSRTVNDPAVQFINGLLATGNDTGAILDDRHLPMGSHHQKVVIVGRGFSSANSSQGKLIAYVGGIEANLDRVPPPVAGEFGSPLFDISVRLENAAAWLVLNSFVARWTAHPNSFGAPLRGAGMPVPSHTGPLIVQVTNTYGSGFPFTTAVQTSSTALANGIKSARQFFYMEDQYFVGSPKMTTAINDAMTANPALTGIVVIAAEDSVADLPDIAFRRRDFLRPLVTKFPGRLLVFERLGGGSTIGPTAYVHSKLLIVDDEAAFIGSVNSNRRSWFHDSEIDATIVDSTGSGGAAPGSRGWVRDFRCNLWSQHLNLSSAILGDFPTSLTFWQAVLSGSFVLIGGTLTDISGTVSVRAYSSTAVVSRYQIAATPVPDALLRKAWDSLEVHLEFF
jgi:phosphatidylserine/phosphatidylglycerophosphate/cardiolipin synthase-like enzyme